jgi:hypothetical protein
MLTKNANMPFLSLHTLAAARGDGLRPEFVKLFTRLAAGADATLSESAQPPVPNPLNRRLVSPSNQ